ncbi:MAG: hypothetical protein ABIR06_22385 [Cyclobacteriaceae bacterium]
MSACNFSIPFSGEPSSILSRAQSAIQDQGGQFKGDDMSGAFQLSIMGSEIRGSYIISGQDLDITIDSKPFLIPCGTIQSYLTKHLQTVGA